MKKLPRRACIFVMLLWAAWGTSLRAAPESIDPLVGDWFYYQNHPVTFQADGGVVWAGAGASGTWEYLRNPEVQRHYRIIWNHGRSVDALVLAEDGQHARVSNMTGKAGNHYEVRRALTDKPAVALATPRSVVTPAAPQSIAATPPVSGPAEAADPILGEWFWFKDRPVTFKPDGTVTSQKNPQGVWEYLHNPEAERKYRVTWGGGTSVDTLSYTRDTMLGHIVNDKGKQYNVHRGAPVTSAPSGPDSHPFGTTR